ncbi:hypothetical protein EVAR_28086_1 [Eumeta japonica]|uniref:(+)RNA virus helicase C-terminal domain-containing protein n=1 Tax=Eumeta variegata TaxID=151549 RepID=A0A4C1W9H3_EUMVA|nr:hypothetical protein EVAR_28086_1 [Eumeta japonica]
MSIIHMAAYSAINGLVALNKEQTDRTERPKYITPSYNQTVVTTQCTRIALEKRILEMVKTVTTRKTSGDAREDWVMPDVTWVNGFPGCARDLKQKLASRLEADACSKVRTMASVLINAFQEPKSCDRLIVNEALMRHFGAIVMPTRLMGAKKILLIGDINQLPFIDRLNFFEMQYIRPNLMATVTMQLLCTYRNPMDMAYALNELHYTQINHSLFTRRDLKMRVAPQTPKPHDPTFYKLLQRPRIENYRVVIVDAVFSPRACINHVCG